MDQCYRQILFFFLIIELPVLKMKKTLPLFYRQLGYLTSLLHLQALQNCFLHLNSLRGCNLRNLSTIPLKFSFLSSLRRKSSFWHYDSRDLKTKMTAMCSNNTKTRSEAPSKSQSPKGQIRWKFMRKFESSTGSRPEKRPNNA